MAGRRTSLGREEVAPLAGPEIHKMIIPAAPGDGSNDSLTIRLADCDGHRNRANMLLNRMYSWRGYGSPHQLSGNPNSVTFTASSDDDLVGTVTLCVDSPDGLAVDQTFKAEVESFRRAPGAKLCELTKLAFDASTPAMSRLAALFHIVFIYGSMHFDCTDLFIEVNPRHVRFYKGMLGFESIGPIKTNRSVDAPSQLMWLNVAGIRRQIEQHSGDISHRSRSLYKYFFSPKEEAGIYGRLLSMTDQSRSVAGMKETVRQLLEWGRPGPRGRLANN